MRLRTPDSRRKVRLKASALNVVDRTAMPAMPGTITSRSSWLPEKIAPKKTRKSSGSRKLKNAALGLRQKSLRSRRYCLHVNLRAAGRSPALSEAGAGCPRRATPSDLIGGQLQVDVLQRWARDLEVVERLAARERLAGQLVQRARRVVGDQLDDLAGRVAVADPHAPRGVDAELARRALGEDAPALDDRHAVGERLRLVEVVRREHDGLAELAQRADRLPGGAARGRVEAGGRLVEEDQLRVADQRQAEVQPPQLAAGQLARHRVLLALQADEREHLGRVARVREHPGEVLERLADADAAVDAGLLQDDAQPLAQRPRPASRVEAEDGDLAAAALAVALEDLDRGRLARPVGPQQPVDLAAADLELDPGHGLEVPVGLAQAVDADGGIGVHRR